MITTRFTELVGCSGPIQQAGIGGYYSGSKAIQPEWVGLLDFEQHWHSAIEAAMAGG